MKKFWVRLMVFFIVFACYAVLETLIVHLSIINMMFIGLVFSVGFTSCIDILFTRYKKSKLNK